ncbi:MAG: putative lipid II flippase FtsW [Patescibacteria group bacterium]
MNWTLLQRKFSARLFKTDQKYDWWLILIVSTLALGGIAFLASASSVFSTARYGSELYLLAKQASLGLWIGFAAAFILSRTDYHKLYHLRLPLLVLSFVLLGWLALSEILFKFNIIDSPGDFRIGTMGPLDVNFATRWLVLFPGFSFQPVEITKFALLIYISSFFLERERQRPEEQQPITILTLKKHLYALGASMILIILQPDLGSALLVFGVCFGSLFIAKTPTKILVTIIAGVMIFATLSILPSVNNDGTNTNYRYTRFVGFLKNISGEADNTLAVNYHTNRVEDAISNGGLWGEGYGNSYYKKRGLIPEAHTDAIIGVIGEEMGFIRTALFLGLYLALAIRGLRTARRAPDLFGRSLSAGIVFWISGQALLNLMSFLELTPASGVPLPFVSYGSTSLLINLAIMGILINISSHGVEPEERPSRVNSISLTPKKYSLRKA